MKTWKWARKCVQKVAIKATFNVGNIQQTSLLFLTGLSFSEILEYNVRSLNGPVLPTAWIL
jgi:hypothetical protein